MKIDLAIDLAPSIESVEIFIAWCAIVFGAGLFLWACWQLWSWKSPVDRAMRDKHFGGV